MKGIEMALAAARHSPLVQHRVGCVLTDKKDNLISLGFNAMKTHPRQAELAAEAGMPYKVFLHAEVSALIRCQNKAPYRAYTARLRKSGDVGLAKPCPICSAALIESGIQEVYYTNNDGRIDLW